MDLFHPERPGGEEEEVLAGDLPEPVAQDEDYMIGHMGMEEEDIPEHGMHEELPLEYEVGEDGAGIQEPEQQLEDLKPPEGQPTGCWTYPPDWSIGDNMRYKLAGVLRVATLNIALSGIGSPATMQGAITHIAQMMSAYAINVLCVQEVHIFQDTARILTIQNGFAQLGLRFTYQGQTKSGTLFKTGRTTTGVGIITAAAYSTEANGIRYEQAPCPGRTIAQMIPVKGEAGAGLKQCGVMSVYGHANATQRFGGKTEAELNCLVAEQTESVREHHNWVMLNTGISVICADANLIHDPLTEAKDNAGQWITRENGFLEVSLNDLLYVDALRQRAGEGTRISTYAGQNGDQAGDTASGTYLDRVLVRGALVFRAGALMPRHFPVGLRSDHGLVVADVECTVVVAPTPPGGKERPEAELSRKFLRKAADSNRKTGGDEAFCTRVRETAQGHMFRVAEAIVAEATELMNAPAPASSREHTEQRAKLGSMLENFRADVYQPTLRGVVGEVRATRRPKAKGITPLQYELLQDLRLACRATHLSHLNAGGERRGRKECNVPIGLDGLAGYLIEAYYALVDAIGGREHETFRSAAPTINTLELIRVRLGLENTHVAAGVLRASQETLYRLSSSMIEASARSDADVWREEVIEHYHTNNVAAVFKMCANSKPKKPAASAATTYLDGGNVLREAECDTHRLIAARQRWEKIYAHSLWKPPPFIEVRHGQGPEGYRKAQLKQMTADQLAACTEGERVAYEGFRQANSNCLNWAAITGPITEADFEAMERMRRGQAPGKSGFKMSAMQYFPAELRAPLRAILQCMWARQLLPEELLRVVLITLPKPDGGERGISLMEEIVKAVEQLLAHRMLNSLSPGHTLRDFLSDHNKAYKTGGACADILHAHALALQHADAEGNPMTCLMTDLAKFYDTVQTDILEVVLQGKGAPASVLNLVRAMYHGSTLTVATQYGDCEPIARKIGIHQGSAFSCLACLLVLEPFHRLQEGMAQEKAYVVALPGAAGTVSIQAAGFCDDHTDYADSNEGMQQRIDGTFPALECCGIGIDAKVLYLSFNLAAAEGGALPTIEIRTYDRTTGGHKILHIPAREGNLTKYRLLGVHMQGAYPCPAHSGKHWAAAQLLRKLGWMRLPVPILRQLIRLSITTRFSGHAPLLAEHDMTQLAKLDTVIANVGRNSVGQTVASPRARVFLTQASGGLQYASAVTEVIAATAREACVLMESRGYLGDLARQSFSSIATHRTGRNERQRERRLLYVAAKTLAQFGFQLRCTVEPATNRMLDILQDGLQHFQPEHRAYTCARAGEGREQARLHGQYHCFSGIAHEVRAFLAEQKGRDQLPATRVYTPYRCTDSVPAGTVLTEARLHGAFATARELERLDGRSFRACIGLQGESWVGADLQAPAAYPHSINRLQHILAEDDCTQLQASRALLRRDNTPSHLVATATDGSTNSAAWVCAGARGANGRPRGQDISAAYGTRGIPTQHVGIASRAWSVARRIGNLDICSYDTEGFAQVYDMLVRTEGVTIGPVFIDNKSIQQRVARASTTTTVRQTLAEGRTYLHALIDEMRCRMEGNVRDDTEQDKRNIEEVLELERQQWWYDVREPASIVRANALTGPGSMYLLVKIKSHTKLERAGDRHNHCCVLGMRLNVEADEAAGGAVQQSVHEGPGGNIRHNPLPPMAEIVFRGESIAGPVARAIRGIGEQDCLSHLADLKARPRQGLAAAMLSDIHPSARNLCKLALPEGEKPASLGTARAHCAVVSNNAMMHSWADLVRAGRINTQVVQAVYEQRYPGVTMNLDAGTVHPAVLRDPAVLCPFCLAAGNMRYGGSAHFRAGNPALRCSNPKVEEARHRVYKVTEKLLEELGTRQAWSLHAPTCNPGGAPRQPVEGELETAQQYPILWGLQWVVNIDVEFADPYSIPPHGVYGLGMRAGTLPNGLTAPPMVNNPTGVTLAAAQARRIEKAKLGALEELRQTIRTVCWEEYGAIQAAAAAAAGGGAAQQEQEQEQEQAHGDPGEGGPQCIVALCDEPRAQEWLPYCTDHTRALRATALCRKYAACLDLTPTTIFGDIRTDAFIREWFWNPKTLEYHAEKMLTSIQRTLTAHRNDNLLTPGPHGAKLWQHTAARTPCSVVFAKMIVRKLLLPCVRNTGFDQGEQRVTWGGALAQIWCACPEQPSQQAEGSDALATCATCRKLQVRAVTGPVAAAACMYCAGPCGAADQHVVCCGCRRAVHRAGAEGAHNCHFDHRILLATTVPNRGWLCPNCAYKAVRQMARTAKLRPPSTEWQELPGEAGSLADPPPIEGGAAARAGGEGVGEEGSPTRPPQPSPTSAMPTTAARATAGRRNPAGGEGMRARRLLKHVQARQIAQGQRARAADEHHAATNGGRRTIGTARTQEGGPAEPRDAARGHTGGEAGRALPAEAASHPTPRQAGLAPGSPEEDTAGESARREEGIRAVGRRKRSRNTSAGSVAVRDRRARQRKADQNVPESPGATGSEDRL
jgi:hypothetical protein